ncbi:helix-turn-helix transcriptional regulator [Saccharospirillum salsuginis]|uniref:Transcriptional regulator n=1 Tax=Saccharospirillum salsuginis TaxID=418750 RepID=A0A918K7J7_9GAMM|nr:helix-turn-helix transcriptional regulator [Saccharospirillum salsuginis]GGX52385.1 transcriptional regulator [Saccharospirillum salsuginis]
MGSANHALAEFRRTKRLSQLDLSLKAEVSARHISFIETGRAQPSRDILLKLAEVMGLSHRECNRLMTECGYAPVYFDRPLDEAAMQPVRQALNVMLDNQDPYPAVVLNSLWDLHMANRSLNRLMSLLLPPDRLQGRINMLELIFDHRGLRPYMTNWDDVAALLLRRLTLQLQTRPNPELGELLETLLSMDPPADWHAPEPQGWEGPMLTSELEINGQHLSVFSTLSSFGTALDVGLQELMIESYFPSDEATRRFFHTLATEAE